MVSSSRKSSISSKEIVKEAIERFIVPELEGYGFRFSPSQLKFTRKQSYARQTITVSLSRYNSEISIDFWTMWGTYSLEYSRWFKQQWGIEPVNNAMGGCSDWNIPGWSYPLSDYHFDLSDPSRRSSVMSALLENIKRNGIPYLESISTWTGAAEKLLNARWMYGEAADFYLIAGMSERAREAIEIGIK